MKAMWRDDISWLMPPVAAACKVPSKLIMSRVREFPLPEVRRGIIWHLRSVAEWSTPRIGQAMRRDHSTIIHALAKGEPTPQGPAGIARNAAADAWEAASIRAKFDADPGKGIVTSRAFLPDYHALKLHILDVQEQLVLHALEQTDGNKTQAAILIKMHRRQFQRIYNRWKGVQKSPVNE